MAMEESKFDAAFNQDEDDNWVPEQENYDLAGNSEGGNFGKLAFFLVMIAASIVGWHAANVYLTPPALTVVVPSPNVAALITPRNRDGSRPQVLAADGREIVFPFQFQMNCIAINGQAMTITPNPVPICLEWMQENMAKHGVPSRASR